MATPTTVEIAHKALPILIHHAQIGRTITYKNLAEAVGRHHRTLMYPLGYIRDDICLVRSLPLLNVIVVNSDDGLPGESFLPEGTGHLSPEEYEQRFRAYRDLVFACKAWDSLLKELGLAPVEKNYADLLEEAREHVRVTKRLGGAGEGPLHRALKMFIAANPTSLGLPGEASATVEYLFPSGDECDVTFHLPDGSHAVVEVKNGDRDELTKGIFQAVKYRALMEAEKGNGKPHPVAAYLAAYRMPEEIVSLASRFGIECRIITGVQGV